MGVALGLGAALGGCSAWRIAYNQGPQWAYWWLDRYADFTEQQEPHVKEALNQWFAWHRRTQLPEYGQLLDKARDEALRDVTDAQVCDWWEAVVRRGDDAFEVTVPAIAAVATTLSPSQLRSVDRRLRKNLADLREEYLQDDLRERHEAAVERTLDRVETFYGRVEPAQRDYVDRMVANSPWQPQRWLAERERRAQDTLATLQTLSTKKGLEPAQAQALVRAWIARSLQPAAADDESQGYYQKLRAYNCAFAAGLHNMTTPAQRRHAAAKLDGWRHDVSELVGSGLNGIGGSVSSGVGAGAAGLRQHRAGAP